MHMLKFFENNVLDMLPIFASNTNCRSAVLRVRLWSHARGPRRGANAVQMLLSDLGTTCCFQLARVNNGSVDVLASTTPRPLELGTIIDYAGPWTADVHNVAPRNFHKFSKNEMRKATLILHAMD